MIKISTRHGVAHVDHRRAGTPRGSLVLTHGAGGGTHAVDLQYLREHLTNMDIYLVEMPWRVAGKKIAPRPSILDECWLDIVSTLDASSPVIVGGRSAGARVALRTAHAVRAQGVLALAFPLHPPGRPESSRASELECDLPLIVVQGERDPFGRPEEFPAGVDLEMMASAGHELRGDRLLVLAVERVLADALGTGNN